MENVMYYVVHHMCIWIILLDLHTKKMWYWFAMDDITIYIYTRISNWSHQKDATLIFHRKPNQIYAYLSKYTSYEHIREYVYMQIPLRSTQEKYVILICYRKEKHMCTFLSDIHIKWVCCYQSAMEKSCVCMHTRT